VVKKSKAARSQTPFYVGLAAIAVLGIALIGWMASRPKQGVTTVDPNLPPAQAEGYLLGNPNAPVTIVEFADFECPACGQFATITEPDVRARLINTGQANLRFYDYPLPMHKNTWPASNAAACAADQGKFWEYHDLLFAGQDKWNGEATSRPKGVFKGYAQQLGLDVDKWETCFDSQTHQPRIMANVREAERRQVGQTPTFIIGDKMIPGAVGYDKLKAYVDSALASGAGRASADSSKKSAGDTAARPAAK
jgi:protein-disulfide isomerase